MLELETVVTDVQCVMCIVEGLLRRNSAVNADIICGFPASPVQWTHGCTYDSRILLLQ